MPAVVSDSSPLICLARLGRLDLLRRLFDAVFIPSAVWQEVAIDGGDREEALQVKEAAQDGWLQVECPGGVSEDSEATLAGLDIGEREAIALALEKGATLIMDEAAGRAAAQRLGLRCTGTLGVLVEAKLLGLIPRLREELDRLQEQTNFRFTPDLFEVVLGRAGEQDSQLPPER